MSCSLTDPCLANVVRSVLKNLCLLLKPRADVASGKVGRFAASPKQT